MYNIQHSIRMRVKFRPDEIYCTVQYTQIYLKLSYTVLLFHCAIIHIIIILCSLSLSLPSLSLLSLPQGYHNVLSSIDCQSLKEVLSLSSRLAEWHEEFSALVNERLESWQDEPSIGDILINTVCYM